jgi:hypothetical protein
VMFDNRIKWLKERMLPFNYVGGVMWRIRISKNQFMDIDSGCGEVARLGLTVTLTALYNSHSMLVKDIGGLNLPD